MWRNWLAHSHGVREVARSSRVTPTKKTHMTKAILFDIDGVLIYSFEANFEFFRRLFIKTGYTPPTREAYTDMYQLPMLGVIQRVTETTDQKEIDRLMDIGKQREGLYPYERIKTPHSLLSVIETLHKTYTLGIVTSRIKGSIFQLPQLAPLEQFFSVIVSFEDTEKHKPHPEPLLHAINQLQIVPEETIYIGDQQADFLAARAAGTKIIMVTKKSFPDADVCIASFENILQAILQVA